MLPIRPDPSGATRWPLCPAPSRRGSPGLTLIELMIALAVAALTIGLVAPGLGAQLDRRRLEAAAAQAATDLRHARSAAIALARPVSLRVQQGPGGACYVLHTGGTGACSCSPDGRADCRAGAESLRVAGFRADGPVQLGSTASAMRFDPDRATVTPTGTLRLSLSDGAAIHQVVNLMGRVRACSPGGTVPGYPHC